MFNSEVTITICADLASVREYWACRFDRFFGATTRVKGEGIWNGFREPNVQVSHLYDSGKNEIDWNAFDVLIKDYKRGAKQDAVLVVYRQVNGQLF